MATTNIKLVDIRLMIGRLRPGAEFGWYADEPNHVSDFGNTLAAITQWRDANTTQPTEAQILAEWDVYLAEQAQRAQNDAAISADLSPVAFDKIQAALDQITAERQQIALDLADLAADQTALQAATTLVAVKPIVADMLQKLTHIANGMDNSRQREARIIKALGRLAARG